jgi:hypothetical protein
MGLGQQAGEHDTVSVILPFVEDVVIQRFVIKVSQGNTARDGTAWVYKDDPTTDKGQIAIGPCNIVGQVGDSTTVCAVDGPSAPVHSGDLDSDSLSVFVNTAGGSFEGASACVLVTSAD